MNPQDLANLDAQARKHIGKPLMDCTWDDLNRLIEINRNAATQVQADADRAQAAIDEGSECGCDRYQAPDLPDGTPDIGRARLVHTCGR